MAQKGRAKKSAGYVYRWWEGDVHRQASFDRAGDRDAFRDELRRMKQARGVVEVGADVTLSAFIEDYWRLHAVPNLEAQTREAYLQQWQKWIRPRLGAYKLRQITPQIINRQLVDELRRAKAGDPTIAKVLAVLQSILALAHAEQRIPENAAKLVRKPPQTVEREALLITPEQVERMRARLGIRDATILSMLGYVGLRPQELLAFTVEDLVETEDAARIRRKNVNGELLAYTKTRRNRKTPMHAPVVEDLKEFMLATGIRKGLLFTRADGQPWTRSDYFHWRADVFKPLAKTIGLPDAVPYDLRAASVSLQVWEGRNMAEVARNHGHSVAILERHYLRIFDDFDPAHRTTADIAIRAARTKIAGTQTLFDIGRAE